MRIGSLCSGAGGLDLAAEAVFGARTAWHCEVDGAASKVLAHRWPGVPNHGDISAIDWDAVEPVGIITAGYPCQPFALAGKRKGTADERHLWPHVREAIRRVRPRITFLENVAGHRSLGFNRVLGDLAEDGMHARWTSVRASDVGAPHRRERLFILVTDPARDGRDEGWAESAGIVGGLDAAERGSAPQRVAALLPTPTTQDGSNCAGPSQFERNSQPLNMVATLLPTPSAADGLGGHLSRSGDRGDELLLPGIARAYGNGELLPTPAASRSGRNQSPSPGAAIRPSLDSITSLLPTPAAADGQRGQDYARASRDGSGGDDLITAAVKAHNANQWGKYAAAIERWEHLTRRAPNPTEPNRNGNPRLNPAFSEWMLGWLLGWVTELIELGLISRNDALRIIGNGVVPQQAIAALRWLLSLESCGVVA